MNRQEIGNLRLYLRGVAIEVPYWALILEAANHDPLRAQEIELEVNQYWWERWLLYRKEKGIADQAEMRKAERKHGRR